MLSSISPIAIVGLAFRLPGGADSFASLERLLAEQTDAIREVPPHRWPNASSLKGEPSVWGRLVTTEAGWLDDPTLFDAEFFGISAREAKVMDPQQRLLLECAYEALQDAGVSQVALERERVGVFIGATLKDYARLQGLETSDGSMVTGTAPSMLANRVSHAFDLHGPSWTVDTACSSSLSALHAACRSLQSGECDRVLVGGVNLIFSPEEFVFFSNAGMLSPDARCRAFDRDGLGYVRAEGVVVLVLKRLQDCAGDRIHAQILNTAANQDGRSEALTVPSFSSQACLLRQVYGELGLMPDQVAYVEAHGTGTPVGDPVEARAIGSVLGVGRTCALPIGSIKTNVGHLEGASGLAGLLKALLVLKTGKLMPNLHFHNPHPNIDFVGLGLHVVQAEQRVALPAVVGVNSFGLGGSNAHAILASAPARLAAPVNTSSGPWLLPVSAPSKAGYASRVQQMQQRLEQQDRGNLCHFSSERSFHHAFRTATLVRSTGEVVLPLKPVRAALARGVAFVFCGQGAIWWASARELLASEPVFAEVLRQCDQILALLGSLSVVQELGRPEQDSRLEDTSVSQPVLCAVQLGLTALWRSWGVQPTAVLAHSAGIPAGACAAGIMGVAEAMTVAFHRGRLMQTHALRGRMLAVQLPAGELEHLPQVVVAAYNGPSSTVLSGPADVLDAYAVELERRGVYARALNVDLCFHHPALAPVSDLLSEALAGLPMREPTVPMTSTVLVKPLTLADLRHDYWSQTVLEPVRFVQAARRLVSEGQRIFLEIGPHPVLAAGLRDVLDEAGRKDGKVFCSLVRGRTERETMLEAAAGLYEAGCDLNWGAINPAGGPWLDLPAYPWVRQSYSTETRASHWQRFGPARHHLLGIRTLDPDPTWEQALSAASFSYLSDHRLGSTPVLSGSTYLAMMASAALEVWGTSILRLIDLRFHEMAMAPDEAQLQLRTTLHLESGRVKVWSSSLSTPERWTLHASARVDGVPAAPTPVLDPRSLALRCPVIYSALDFAVERPNSFVRTGVFDCVNWVRVGSGEVFLSARGTVEPSLLLHPGWMDACFYGTSILVPSRTSVPVGIEELRLHRAYSGNILAHLTLRQSDARFAKFDLRLADEAGQVVLEVVGYSVKVLDTEADREAWWVGEEWIQQDLPQSQPPSGRWALVGAASALLEQIAERAVACGNTVQRFRNHEGLLEFAPTQVLSMAGGSLTASGLPALVRALCASPAPLTVVTQGVSDEPDLAAVWGFVRSVISEQPALQARLVDVAVGEGAADALWFELGNPRSETEVRWEAGRRRVARMGVRSCEWLQDQAAISASDYRVEIDGSGNLEHLRLDRLTPVGPGPGEIQLHVEAAALNFVDLMTALNLLPGREGRSPLLGTEAAGTVTEVGEGVLEPRVGDRVVAIGSQALASRLTARADYCMALAPEARFVDWAGLPGVFLTAIYALSDLARLQPGERVLIHSAAGGLGLAAIQVARKAGAEIYATAGTEEKRRWLLRQGVRACFDSRSLAWVEDLRQSTGDGVDVILNSLAGENIIAFGLDLLRPYGRFVEVGKRDVWGGGSLSLRPFRKNLGYFAVDLEDAISQKPALIRRLLETLRQGLASGEFTPLPVSTRPLTEAVDMFRTMTQGLHTGKLVLTRPEGEVSVRPGAWTGLFVKADATYLVVGTRGAGLATAFWLSRMGARHLLLVSRSGKLDQASRDLLRQQQTQVEVVALDVTERESLVRVLAMVPTDRPVRGVFHAAMVLEDALVADLSTESLERVLGPKTQGSWNLHQCTLGCPLDFFVMYSSVASILGSPGQSAYCAANAYQDSLAWLRHRQGLPGLSINWPALSDFGVLSRNPELLDYLEKGGLRTMDGHTFFVQLEAALRARVPQIGILQLSETNLRGFAVTPRLEPLLAESQKGPGVARTPLEAVRAAGPHHLRAVVAELTGAQLARILRVEVERLDLERPLLDLGMDSLMSLELRNWLVDAFGVTLASGEALRTPTVLELSELVAERLSSVPAASAQPDELDLSSLSDEEVDAMLEQLVPTAL